MEDPQSDDFAIAWPPQDEAIRDALLASYLAGDWGRYDGPSLEQLSEQCQTRFQVEHALPCSSGTVAVELALRGMKIGAGDEVVMAAYDFAGNFRCIHAVGARPVIVDLARDRWTLDIEQVARAIRPATKAIIASHLHGDLAPIQQLRELADAHGIGLIEDACQAAGAVAAGQPVGAWGHAATLSFGGSKLLTAGRGGMLLTNDAQIRQRIIIATRQGNNAYPLSELQAAVLLPQLKTLDALNQKRRQGQEVMLRTLEGLPLQGVEPEEDRLTRTTAFRWAFRCLPESPLSRDELAAKLREMRIPMDAGFRGFTRRTGGRCERLGELSNAQDAIDNTLLLHHGLLLREPDVVRRAAETIAGIIRP